MRLKFVQVLLLLMMAFNIAHASILAEMDHCTHERVSEFIVEQDQSTQCGDLRDLHHLFHLSAIVETSSLGFDREGSIRLSSSIPFHYYPPFKETAYKPPIA